MKQTFFIGFMMILLSAYSKSEQKHIQNFNNNGVVHNTNYENISNITDGKTMNKKPLIISIYCANNPQCIYSGEEEIAITIEFQNNSDTNIRIPLRYKIKTGPEVKIIDKKTGQSIQLPISLARKELLEDLTLIPPGQKVSWEGETVTKGELEYFGRPVDVLLEIVVYMDIFVNDEKMLFKDKALLHVKGDY